MNPITIKRGTFEAHLYDVGGLMELPLANVRRLWKLMLEDTSLNKDAVATVQNWLPAVYADTGTAVDKEQERLQQVVRYANALHSKVAAFGSMVTKEQKAEIKEASTVLRYAEKRVKNAKSQHIRAKKLQTIFNEMTES